MAPLNYIYDPQILLPEIKGTIDVMYPASDDKARMDEWVELFTKTATVWKNGKNTEGTHEDLKKMLQDSWNNVKARTHNVDRVFVLGIGAHEVIVDGTTDYEWEDGRKQVGKWASRMHYAEEGGKLKVTEYQVQFVWCN